MMSHQRRVVAFLQNQWFKDAVKARSVFKAYGDARRAELVARFLFRGCLTGRRLQKAFGPELCEQILWEETSRDIGDNASSIFPPDIEHMHDVLRTYCPEVVITFGKHAENAFLNLMENFSYQGKFLRAMHPAARHPDIQQSLNESARQLRELLTIPSKDIPL
jgi:hypothetical protein